MRRLHPADFRRAILLAAVVAMAVWWGLGLPYSMTAWLLDDRQRSWTLICYAWEVPTAGLLGPVFVPQWWWRDVVRRWDRAFGVPDHVDAEAAREVEARILDYPIRVGWVLLVTSFVGYGVGAAQLYAFAQLPIEQLVHVALLGVATGLVGGLFAFLYLERLLTPLLFELGRARLLAAPAGRRVPLRTKVFACSLVLLVATVLLFGTVFWNQSARLVEREAGKRLMTIVRQAAERTDGAWTGLGRGTDLGASGRAYVVDASGVVVAGDAGAVRRIDDEGFRAAVARTVLAGAAGHVVDRAGRARIVAFAPTRDGARHVVAVVPRADLQRELAAGLRTAAAIFLTTLFLALASSYLFARRLGRPIELVTAVANRSARGPDTAWELAPVRTNDEVGDLAVALNHMTTRLGEARDALARINVELEDRVKAATRNISSLYDTTKAITSTIDPEDVLPAIEHRIQAALGLRDVVLLRASPVGTVEAYTSACGRIDLGPHRDLTSFDGTERPSVCAVGDVLPALPPSLQTALAGPHVLRLPLTFKDARVGVVLGSVADGGAPDLDFAGAIASQTAVALANVALFETVRRHEIDLRELSERQVQLREDLLRSLSRELHDGLGQALAAIKVDLASIEQTPAGDDPAALRGRIREVHGQVTELIQEVRRMSQLLRPSMLDDLGLMPSLRMLVESVGSRAAIAIELRTPTVERRLPPAIEVLLFRVTQEALTNMVKHARARRAWVELDLDDAHATLTIRDDGIGFDVDGLRRRRGGERGLGLLGMRERVAYHHGTIDIRSRPGDGVRITLAIPLAAEDAEPARDGCRTGSAAR